MKCLEPSLLNTGLTFCATLYKLYIVLCVLYFTISLYLSAVAIDCLFDAAFVSGFISF